MIPPTSTNTGAGTGVSIKKKEPVQSAADFVAAIVASSNDAIVSRDLQSRVTSWNKGAEAIFGYTAREMVGAPLSLIIPAELRHEDKLLLQQIKSGKRVEDFETLRKTKDGRLIHVSVSASPVQDSKGRITGAAAIARDITKQKLHERELFRLSKLYAALSQINHSIVSTSTRDALFARTCETLVDRGGFRSVWIGWHDPDTHMLLPVASHGDIQRVLDNSRFYADDRPEGRGPTGTAFRERRPYICNDTWNDPATEPWRAQIQAFNWNAVAAFPIFKSGKACATITVYAEERNFFQEKEVSLLTEVASDISFAIDNFARDETRREIEQTVRDERDFTGALINSLPGILYSFDRYGRFLRWNKDFERVSGYGPDEIKNMQPTDFFPEVERAVLRTRIEEVFKKGSSSIEGNFLSKDGQLKPHYFTGVKTEINGHNYVVGVGIDVTERKQAEQARQAAEDAAREAQSDLTRVARVALIGEMVATIAHEINQPLASIVAYGDAALRWLEKIPPNLEETRDAIRSTKSEAGRMHDLIRRIRAGVVKESPVYVSLNLQEVIGECLTFIRGEQRRANVVIHTEFLPDLPLVQGDRVQLQQVMHNLILNGIDAMRLVTDRPRLLQVRTMNGEPGQVLVEVEDSGCGLDPAAKDRIFEAFFTTKQGGTGLGLRICRTIVEAHGGRIWATPATLHGTVFNFSLPVLGVAKGNPAP
jgi:PAS domain S-box-containing protein